VFEKMLRNFDCIINQKYLKLVVSLQYQLVRFFCYLSLHFV